jgi:gamma-glutamylputrescine oxidase
MSKPFWLEEEVPPRLTPRYDGRVDVAIVGAGVTGCACALALAEAGLRVRVHDAREVGGGASGRNGGFALRGGASPYDVAREQLGADRAKGLWDLTERSLDELESLAGDAFRRTGSLRLAADAQEAEELRTEYDALLADGFAAAWLPTLDGRLGDRFAAALLHPSDGSIHPARWVRSLASRAAAAGADIREHDRVESVDGLGAENVVIATDGYTQGLLPELDGAITPTRGQVLVTEPLDESLFARPHYSRRGYDYWQQTPDGRLVIGGRRDFALEAEFTAEEETTEAVQREIERLIADLLGFVPPVTHRWAGIFGMTPDLLPLVGRIPGRDGAWVAAGYSGHGNVLGLACGELVAQAILGREPHQLELFDPARAL